MISLTDEEIGVCKRLKQFRKAIGLNQTDFGKKIEVAQGYLTNIETCRQPVTPKIFKLVCLQSWDGKTINESWLRTGKGDMFDLLTEQEKIMKYTSLLLKDKDSVIADCIKSFIITYEQLDDSGKKFLEETALKILENMKTN